MERCEDEGRRKVGEVVGKGWRSSGEMKRYGREKGWRSVNVKLKKNIKNNYKKMERKKIMSWTLT